MSLPPYPAFKNSGVEWIGKVPDHWEVKAIKRLSAVRRGASPRPIDDPKYFDESGEYAWVRIADVSASAGVLSDTTQRLSKLGSSLSVKIEPGELFVSIAGTVGKPCISAIKACIHDGFVYFPNLTIDPKYLFRIFEAGQCYAGLGKMGTQLNLNTETIGSIKLALPPAEEIPLILQFIEHETAKIDALIEEQERLAALMREQLASMALLAISDSTQKSVRLMHLVEQVDRPVVLESSPSYVPLGLLNRGRGLFHKDETLAGDMGDSEFSFVKSGDLIFSGQFAWEGAVAMAGDEEEGCVVSHRYPVIRGIEILVLTEYIYAFFLTSHGLFLMEENSRGAAGRNRPLNIQLLLKEKIPVPDMNFQKKIKKAVGSLIQLRKEMAEQKRLLLERRACIILLAVTGKIDVRGLNVGEPEEIEEAVHG